MNAIRLAQVFKRKGTLPHFLLQLVVYLPNTQPLRHVNSLVKVQDMSHSPGLTEHLHNFENTLDCWCISQLDWKIS